eukprot:TRINITY_DN44948_c0_g1_i1.p1 TRINITY_DN44948_c0_g1~~TRINITY_DN44948_c0_g1_i1.p1  ORF type:complete len:317 (-),score=40.30 TRINITY_DN44948_c0_g1_i1:83-1033(-)
MARSDDLSNWSTASPSIDSIARGTVTRPHGWPRGCPLPGADGGLMYCSRTSFTQSLWEDLKAACPWFMQPQPRALASRGDTACRSAIGTDVASFRGPLPIALGLSVVLVAWLLLPVMRVDNGSEDSCDPIRTYGEITLEGMQSLIDQMVTPVTSNLNSPRGAFVDIGSGRGGFVRWACSPEGGAFERCVGVEVQQSRHEEALKALAADSRQRLMANVTLLHADITRHIEVLSDEDVRLVYWNNLCFPDLIGRTVAEHFARATPETAVLVTLAALPEPLPEGLQTVERLAESLRMAWREEGYRPYIYRREASVESRQ